MVLLKKLKQTATKLDLTNFIAKFCLIISNKQIKLSELILYLIEISLDDFDIKNNHESLNILLLYLKKFL